MRDDYKTMMARIAMMGKARLTLSDALEWRPNCGLKDLATRKVAIKRLWLSKLAEAQK